MTAKIIPINKRQNEAWAAYLHARDVAEASGILADGVEAGRAWRRWLDLFMTPEQQQSLSGQVRAIR